MAEDPPDLVLLDIMMPKIDGLEVVRRMKADKSLPFIPVILVTAKATPKDVVAGLDAGGDDYLTKPIDHGALVARVRAMLRIKALHDEVQALNRRAREPRSRRRSMSWNASAGCAASWRRNLPKLSSRRAIRRSWRMTGARSLPCSATCAASPAETAEPEDIMTLLAEITAKRSGR